MIQIDMEMPKSCSKCPFFDNDYETCPLVSMIPAIQKDVRYSTDKRSQYCPMKEIPEEHFKLEVPEKCGDCKSMAPYGQKYYCHMDALSSDSPHQDISTIFIEPESRPNWCPMIRLNKTVESMSPDRRTEFDKFATGLSALFGSPQVAKEVLNTNDGR